MAVKKTGLGKGLDALFSTSPLSDDKEEEKVVEKIDESEKIHKIKITEIEPNKNQPRRNFNSESIDELAESIKRYGVIQPIIVSKKDNYYEIIAGERRWRASKKAGLTEMPCIIRESEEKENKEIALIENIQREDLNPIEKARSFRTLLDEYGLTQQELADTLGISRSALTNTVRLLNLDPRVIDLALEGKLTEGHCRSLVVVDDPDKQYEMALQVIENGDSVREVERMVKGKKQGKAKNTRNAKYEAIYKDIEDRFQGFFGTKVKLDAGRKKGKIIIELIAILIAIVLIGVIGMGYYKKGTTKTQNPIVTMEVKDLGTIKLELYPDKAPNTVANFIKLANNGFYDGLTYHRIVKDFMVQGGDKEGTGSGSPTLGDLKGEENDEKYSIKGEFVQNGFNKNDIRFEKGVIAMARSDYSSMGMTEEGYNSAGSQFFIMTKDNANLNGQYAAFGKVIEGLDVLDKLNETEVKPAESERSEASTPVNAPVITSIKVETNGVDYGEPETMKPFDYSSYMNQLYGGGSTY